ncbi:MAG TPA: cupin domain-containing protein [Phycisphaerae bacterium]|nr:cupin domain-containing protein [Phycisphaerae bacterium]HNU46589.1 cupin domain-containing protein [Phycisphaerae bacterium]
MTQEKAGKCGTTSKAKMPAGEVLDLAGLVEYGAGAIVSRTLVGNHAGTITLFAFDADQGLSEHTTPFDAFVQVVEGAGEFTVGGEPFQVGSGQILLMPAGVPHAVRGGGRFKMLLAMLRAGGGSTEA